MGNSVELDMEQYINAANSEVPSDQRVVSPEGEYTMFVKPGSTRLIEGESDKGKWKKYTAIAIVDEPAVREATNLENPTARVQFFLDVNEDGVLVTGTNRNTQLGRLLKATGNDKPGWTWGAIEGVSFKGRVKHIADRTDAEKKHPEVVAFARA